MMGSKGKTFENSLKLVAPFSKLKESRFIFQLPSIISIVVSETGTNFRVNYANTAPNPIPTIANFNWFVNGNPISLVGSSLTSGTGFFAAEVNTRIFQGDVVTATYVEPNTNLTTLRSVANYGVTNNSTVDGTPPTSDQLTNTSDGTTLTLTFNEDLSESPPPLVNQFSVSTNGYPTSILLALVPWLWFSLVNPLLKKAA